MPELLHPPTRPALKGAALIKSLLPRLPNEAGVYRMQDERGEVLYVGKAKSLPRRVAAYSRPKLLSARLQRMVALTASMEFVTTASEVEALLLEANLIKRFRPAFNIVFRDDKSFPYIYLRRDHDFPLIGKHRGAKRLDADYYGPFASAGAVNDTLNALLKAFPLRSCRDSIFSTRSRPCLQYQIKRCSAPCVGRIDKESYAAIVAEARAFLSGRSGEMQERLQAAMREASARLDFELAAVLRDRVKALAHIHSRQGINTEAVEDADVIAAHTEAGQTCVQVFFYRGGRNYGNRAYYPSRAKEAGTARALTAFVAQFYAERPAPPLVLLSEAIDEQALVAEALAVQGGGRRVTLAVPQRGDKRQLVEIALSNARQALARHLAETQTQETLLEQLAERFDLPDVPKRIEVYDNSHIQGRDAIGAFIVAGPNGFDKKSYRTFNIKGGTPPVGNGEGDVPAAAAPVAGAPEETAGDVAAVLAAVPPRPDAPSAAAAAGTFNAGDDYAMMHEVLHRRFARLVKEDPERAGEGWPDLVLIDGGAGQLAAAEAALAAIGLTDLPLIGVAKGPERDAGRERFFRPGQEPVMLDPRDPVLYFVQRLRDEAHRFAINTHRGKRARGMGRSALDGVPGIGARRKRALLDHFGSARGVGQAGLLDLERVPGINKTVARTIYDHFHDRG